MLFHRCEYLGGSRHIEDLFTVDRDVDGAGMSEQFSADQVERRRSAAAGVSRDGWWRSSQGEPTRLVDVDLCVEDRFVVAGDGS